MGVERTYRRTRPSRDTKGKDHPARPAIPDLWAVRARRAVFKTYLSAFFPSLFPLSRRFSSSPACTPMQLRRLQLLHREAFSLSLPPRATIASNCIFQRAVRSQHQMAFLPPSLSSSFLLVVAVQEWVGLKLVPLYRSSSNIVRYPLDERCRFTGDDDESSVPCLLFISM